MGTHFTKPEIRQAKCTDLYDFCLSRYPDSFTREGKYLRSKDTHSIVIKQGSDHYFDNGGNSKSTDAISLLMTLFGLTFTEAVEELLSFKGQAVQERKLYSPKQEQRTFTLPVPGTNSKAVYDYLTIQRGIDRRIIDKLIKSGLLYQDDHRNAVFINYSKDAFEIRGTYTPLDKRPYKRTGRKSPDRFWYCLSGEPQDWKKVYICESAIDSISLLQIRQEPGCYASMAGVSNYQIIERIKQEWKGEIILAVDNDTAGDNLRQKYSDLPTIKPQNKDWNEVALLKSQGL